jgi:hypothetical protein
LPIASWGLFDGAIHQESLVVDPDSAAARALLLHEYTHAVITRSIDRFAPGWFQEGVAQWVTGDDVDAARARLAGTPAMALADLTEQFSRFKSADDARRAYDTALMMMAPALDMGGAAKLAALRDRLHNDEPFDTGFTAAFGIEPRRLLDQSQAR